MKTDSSTSPRIVSVALRRRLAARIFCIALAAPFVIFLLHHPMANANPLQFSADINGDALVNSTDFGLFLNDFAAFSTPGFFPGDIDLDGRVAPLCDGNLLLEQFSGGASGSTATVAASYDPITGAGSLTVTPSTAGPGGVSAIYLVNTSGAIAGTAFTVPTAISPIFNFGPTPAVLSLTPPAVTSGYLNPASSVQYFDGGDTLVGTSIDLILGTSSRIPTSATFNIPALTPVTDLQFFYQRIGQAAKPIPILDQVANTTYVTNQVLPCPCAVPEPPATTTSLLLVAMGAITWRRLRAW